MIVLGLRYSAFRWIALAATLSACAPGRAAEADPTTKAVGGWTLMVADGSRQCRMMLRSDLVASGYGVGMPVGCHLAFPFLAGVKMWTEVGAGKLQFEDAQGQPLLAFEPDADGKLSGTGPQGESLRLEPVGHHRATVLKVAAAKGNLPKTAKLGVAKAAAKLPMPSVAEMAGHYAVLRQLGKDTGCMVTLDDKAHGPGGSLKANLAPACRDQGIVIFDPVGWQLEASQLVLTARKGHTTKLDLQPDGAWTKDSAGGKTIGLKKM